MKTKRLSDIGVKHDRLEGYVTLTKPLVWFTFEERREFAYELIRAWERARWIQRGLLTPEKFLEEQGL